MPDLFFISDTHFGHENILTFKAEDGRRIRHQFESVQEMDDAIITRWNERVKPGDKIYHLGDVIMGPRSQERLRFIMKRLNGRKRLVVGNHDDIESICATGVFEKIGESRKFAEDGFLISHRPTLIDHAGIVVRLNVHGHIHEKPDPSPHHMNISVERTEYRPIHLDEIIAEIKRRGL